jgi:hypothetical protein
MWPLVGSGGQRPHLQGVLQAGPLRHPRGRVLQRVRRASRRACRRQHPQHRPDRRVSSSLTARIAHRSSTVATPTPSLKTGRLPWAQLACAHRPGRRSGTRAIASSGSWRVP